jgi:hypothetical protein
MRFSLSKLPFPVIAVVVGLIVVFNRPSGSLGSVLPLDLTAGVDQGSPRLIIDSRNHTLTIATTEGHLVTLRTHGAWALKRGTYEITAKEIDPLWRPPTSYYLRRGLQVPEEDSPSRVVRAALGHRAIILNRDLPIHSGPVWNDDIGGLKVSEDDMGKLFRVATVGSRIEVR